MPIHHAQIELCTKALTVRLAAEITINTATFTVGGEKLEDLIASNADYAKYEAYVSDGYFHESELASAPAFDIAIDGITMLG